MQGLEGGEGGGAPEAVLAKKFDGGQRCTQGSMRFVNDASHVSAVAIYLTARWY